MIVFPTDIERRGVRGNSSIYTWDARIGLATAKFFFDGWAADGRKLECHVMRLRNVWPLLLHGTPMPTPTPTPKWMGDTRDNVGQTQENSVSLFIVKGQFEMKISLISDFRAFCLFFLVKLPLITVDHGESCKFS